MSDLQWLFLRSSCSLPPSPKRRAPISRWILSIANAIVDSGLTPDEADCWERVTRFGADYFALPKLPQTDNGPVVTAIHVVQDKSDEAPGVSEIFEAHQGGLIVARN